MAAPAPVAPEPLQYVTVDREGPPGLVTAIGVCSIIIAGISILFSAMVTLKMLPMCLTRKLPQKHCMYAFPSGKEHTTGEQSSEPCGHFG